MANGHHQLNLQHSNSNHFVCSPSTASCRKFPWIRASFALCVFVKFGWNIVWLHQQGIHSAMNPFVLDLQRQTTSDENVSNALHLQSQRRDQSTDNERRKSRKEEEESETDKGSPRLLNQKRQQRTRLPSNNARSQSDALPTGPWQKTPQRVIMPWKHNWQILCENANMDSTSRVIITNVLTQPPGQPLALFLATQCGVKDILGIDPLFPNHQKDRLEQMENYRDLKRGIDRMQLIVPSADFSTDHDDSVQDRMVAFQPTHVIHLATYPPEYDSVLSERNTRLYAIKSGLKLVNDALQCVAQVYNASHDRWHQPRFVYVTSNDSTETPWTELASVLVKTYQSMYGFSTTLLHLPYLYGPMVASPTTVADYYMHEKMYVTNAMACILTGLEYNAKKAQGFRSIYARQMVVDIDSGEGVTPEITYYQLKRHHKKETGAWIELDEHDHLGNAVTEADYLDFYGVPRDHFPCASMCEDYECLPSAFDEIKELVREASDGCIYSVYFGNFSTAFEYLEQPKPDDSPDDEVCRFAFVSGQSRFVRNMLSDNPIDLRDSQDGDSFDESITIDVDVLRSKNGKHDVDGWTIFWLPEHHEGSMTDADLALLRIDPAALFAKTVLLALYTEKPSFMKATDSQLLDVFDEMELEEVGARMRKAKRPGTSVWQMVKIRRQRARRVLFYAKEPRRKPQSMQEFVRQSTTWIPSRQIAYYNESISLITSNEKRPQDEIKSSVYDEFPFQWFDDDVIMHDLGTRYGQEFRCSWYKEFLLWGGQRDAELLSLAYTMGKRRIEGLYGERQPRLDSEPRDFSWIPVMDKDYPDYRLHDKHYQEIFIRVVPP
ncbi:hypothetical protein MPSEU_000904700 [Mayamaea pseudoterrestris]|nr:hypothetical protein MPSEU_000904700 [Mayamaea pseudoterrestris]